MDPKNPDRIAFLKSVDILAKAKDEDIAAVAAICQERSWAHGEPLFHEGKPGNCVFLIKTGEVRCDRAGSEITRMRVGETLGVSSFLDNGPRTVDAVAEGPV